MINLWQTRFPPRRVTATSEVSAATRLEKVYVKHGYDVFKAEELPSDLFKGDDDTALLIKLMPLFVVRKGREIAVVDLAFHEDTRIGRVSRVQDVADRLGWLAHPITWSDRPSHHFLSAPFVRGVAGLAVVVAIMSGTYTIINKSFVNQLIYSPEYHIFVDGKEAVLQKTLPSGKNMTFSLGGFYKETGEPVNVVGFSCDWHFFINSSPGMPRPFSKSCALDASQVRSLADGIDRSVIVEISLTAKDRSGHVLAIDPVQVNVEARLTPTASASPVGPANRTPDRSEIVPARVSPGVSQATLPAQAPPVTGLWAATNAYLLTHLAVILSSSSDSDHVRLELEQGLSTSIRGAGVAECTLTAAVRRGSRTIIFPRRFEGRVATVETITDDRLREKACLAAADDLLLRVTERISE